MLGDMAIYEPAGNPSSSVGVIVVYDVFAFKVANTRAQAHILKVSSMRPLYCKYTMALTFEDVESV